MEANERMDRIEWMRILGGVMEVEIEEFKIIRIKLEIDNIIK